MIFTSHGHRWCFGKEYHNYVVQNLGSQLESATFFFKNLSSNNHTERYSGQMPVAVIKGVILVDGGGYLGGVQYIQCIEVFQF